MFEIIFANVLFAFVAWMFSINVRPLIKIICLLVLFGVICIGFGYLFGIGFHLVGG
jgi:hypothetical protein